MERRDFIKNACLLCGAAAVMRFVESCETYHPSPYVSFTIDLNDPAYSALSSAGGYAYHNGVIIMCTGPGAYNALSQVCTHAGCTVTYDTAANNVFCPCHKGTFDLSGNVISGPPPGPLRQYKVTQNGNILTISA